MSEESKIVDEELSRDVAADSLTASAQSKSEDADQGEDDGQIGQGNEEEPAGKKKKSKKSKLKKALGKDDDPAEGSSSSNPSSRLTTGMVEQLMEMNPSLKNEVANMDKNEAAEKLRSLDVASLLTGMVYFTLALKRLQLI